ncbi:hypothetical protein SAMN05444000_1302 [Shimia gijangensis]|uniref:Uncharacterized protein n=1 Tax=Shimia gijangensis TaxID=1470563 RepID=A0A1M6SIB4_9RHOB|nr:hypothetical protein [Shimia gijangensis]SHK44524.1 hypothetical protein SAMN05444000_1302 [Shimia gijangensis]
MIFAVRHGNGGEDSAVYLFNFESAARNLISSVVTNFRLPVTVLKQQVFIVAHFGSQSLGLKRLSEFRKLPNWMTPLIKTGFFVPSFLLMVWLVTGRALAQQQTEPIYGLQFYGQINRGYLYHDDGGAVTHVPFAGGSKSPGRFGLTYGSALPNGWNFLGRGEMGIEWKETDRVSQRDPLDDAYDFDKEALRKLEVQFSHPEVGTFFVGQGAMSGSDAAAQDLSLTNVVAGAAVRGVSGGMFLRQTDGTLSNIYYR